MNQPKPFEILDHTADIRLRVTGKTKEELFRNALRGLAGIIKERASGREVKRKIKLQSVDPTALLVDFLNEALYLANINKEVYTDVEFTLFSDAELSGEVSGFTTDTFQEDIKAVTHHEARIKQTQEGYYEVTLVLDI